MPYENNTLQKSGLPVGCRDHRFLHELNVPFEIKNVGTHPQYAAEREKKSGKCVSPTLDFDGQILADASVEDVGRVLEKSGM